jgi:hypothetical protein
LARSADPRQDPNERAVSIEAEPPGEEKAPLLTDSIVLDAAQIQPAASSHRSEDSPRQIPALASGRATGENASAVTRGRIAVRTGLAAGAVTLTAWWFAELEWSWSAFWSSEDWAKGLQSAPAISDVLILYGGAVGGALAGFATGGRARLVVGVLAGIVGVTIAAFVVMPWDAEAEGGAGDIKWWAITAAVAALICAGLSVLLRRVTRPRPT